MINNLEGMKFGDLEVIKCLDEEKSGKSLWECRCDCGKKCMVSSRDLKYGRKTSCGCQKGFQRHLEGRKFGHLTVIEETGEKQRNVKMWLCRCDCGKMIKVRTDSLTSGRTISCGCSKSQPDKIKLMVAGLKITDHTSTVFFKNTISKNNTTGINGVSRLKNGKYRAYIGYKNKTYSLIEDYDIEVARLARIEAEEAVKNGKFEEWLGEFRNGEKHGRKK